MANPQIDMSSPSRLLRALHLLSLFIGLVVATGSSPAKLHWPNPQLSYIDNVLYGSSPLPFITGKCGQRHNTTVAAEWIRLAYHDMSTHDVNDGSGGLDASIIYELDRPQNIGIGMTQSLIDFSSGTTSTPYVSLADLIAIGAVLGAASCGGPVIPYRAGRIDASEAGPATVPEPQQDLQSHIASFQRQGFNQSEMIALVACGHTVGGVRSADFPTIVDGSLGVDVADFDSTVNVFDPTVVTEYLNNTSVNPLVVTPNVTMQSDLRIFSSDGNYTMQSIATNDAFNATCGSLLERMINTVPRGVTLTDPIEPFENKVTGFSFYTHNGSYVLNVTLRRLTQNPSRTVTLHWLPRHLPTSLCPSSGCLVNSTLTQTSSFLGFFAGIKGISASTKYLFSVQAPLNASISRFWFVVDENDGSEKMVVDNYGTGFVIEQDTVLYNPVLTKRDSAFNYLFVVGVRNDSSSSQIPVVSIQSYEPGFSPTFTPTIITADLQIDPNYPPADGYNFFTADFPEAVTAIHIDASTHGQQFRLYREETDFLVSS